MRKQLLGIAVLCAASLAIGAQAQSSSDPSGSSSSSGSQGSSSGYSSQSKSGWTGGRLSPTGRMGHEECRASQLTGAQITGSSGSELGTVSDVIIDPYSGRLDFAIISVNPSAGSSTGSATTPGGTSSSLGTSSSTSGSLGTSSSQGGATSPGGLSSTTGSSTGGKQVAVPWALLRPSMTSSSSTSATSSTTGQQPTFVYSGDATKLESAPSFDATTDLSQPGWKHSVFSYFGLSGRSARGSAFSPGGASEGSSSTTPQSQEDSK